MALTYKLIASSTVGSGGAANIEFTSIPGTYTDLLLKFSIRTNVSQVYDEIEIIFNSNTSNYSHRTLYGFSTGVGSFSSGTSPFIVNGDTSTASTFGNGELYIPNYASANFKSASGDTVNESNGTSGVYQYLTAYLWSNTSAITSIKLQSVTPTKTFLQYTTARLYGILKP